MTKKRRRRALVIGAWSLVVLPFLGAPALAVDAAEDVAQLIERLGDPRYAERRDARRRLLDAGLGAFDAIHGATDHPDPEVADACEGLLAELTLEWAWPDDPPRVRQRLEEYGRLSPADRLEAIRLLAQRRGDVYVPALARLARFEPSGRAAREAASALLSSSGDTPDAPGGGRLEAIREALADLQARYGDGKRPTVAWLRLASTHADDDARGRLDAWRRHVADERRLLDRRRGETAFEVLANLHWQWLRAALEAGDDRVAVEAAEGTISLRPDGALARTMRSLLWASALDRPGVVEALLDAHGDKLTDKRGLYVRARIAAAAGDAEEAERLAAAALESEALVGADSAGIGAFGPEIAIAGGLKKAGHAEWAHAEYAAAGAQLDPLTEIAVMARSLLAESLHDAARYGEAAETLGELTGAINASPNSRRSYNRLIQKRRRGSPLPTLNHLVAREHLARALAARAAGDRNAEIAALNRSISATQNDPEMVDVLIAMHQVADPPERFAKVTRAKIAQQCRAFEQMIARNPTDPGAFNGWAWLVSNTEGDFDKAVRYSRRSLELYREAPSFLDTLGRCLFSAGRVEEAVAAQRRAVELEPTMLVMQRQLAEFEAALAEQSDSPPDES